ncbi:MAG: helix-turn-helix domain-containing protein [Myxococcales bacterium]|jgi:DNA-binding protein Fis
MPDAAKAPARRVVVTAAPLPDEVSQALAAAGLEVRQGGDATSAEVLLVDPSALSCSQAGIEDLIASRTAELLGKLGDTVPALHEAVLSKAERGLLRAVLAHTENHLGRASKILGLDRNTCARKARAFGLLSEPSRGRKPSASRSSKTKKVSAARSRAGRKSTR